MDWEDLAADLLGIVLLACMLGFIVWGLTGGK